jgi:hypothetical protein
MSIPVERLTKPCKCLRTKNRYGSIPQNAESWLPGVASSSTYWCLRTIGPAGPDDHYVHLSHCTPSRVCFEQTED